MSSFYPYRPLAEIVADGLISDGDWIESKDQDPDGSVRLIQLADIGDGRYLNKSKRFLTKETASRLKCTSLRQGDIIVARMPDPIGRACIYPGDAKEAITVVDVCILRVDEKAADARWLMSAINADFTRRAIERAAGGTTRTRISRGSLEKLLLPCPPLPKQQKIATILTAVDDKLDVIARQIEATQTLKQGLMQTLFSRGVGTQDADGRWVPHAELKDSELGRIPSGWSVRSLGSVTEEVRERNSGKLDDALLCGVLKEQGLVPMRERVKGATTERCRVVGPSAFAYNPMRINIGSIARNLRDHSVMVSPDYVVFATRPGELLPSFLDHFRRSDMWQRFVGRSGDGGVRIRIYYDDLAQLRLKVPPLPEQVKVVEILDCLTTKLNQLGSKRDGMQALKRGLMQKLLTGEWRVSVDASATGT